MKRRWREYLWEWQTTGRDRNKSPPAETERLSKGEPGSNCTEYWLLLLRTALHCLYYCCCYYESHNCFFAEDFLVSLPSRCFLLFFINDDKNVTNVISTLFLMALGFNNSCKVDVMIRSCSQFKWSAGTFKLQHASWARFLWKYLLFYNLRDFSPPH